MKPTPDSLPIPLKPKSAPWPLAWDHLILIRPMGQRSLATEPKPGPTPRTCRNPFLLAVLWLGLVLSACQPSAGSQMAEGASPDSSEVKGLHELASFPIGGAVSTQQLLQDARLREIALTNFNSLTATNDMKMYSLKPTEGPYRWQWADSLVNFCQTHDLRLFGHTLVWHYGAPNWLQEQGPIQGAAWVDSVMRAYIDTVVGRYRGQVAAWDVVNEAFATKGGDYRRSFWYEMLGPAYIEKAFRYAHAVDPEAELFYNDFNLERDTAKLHGVLRMIEDFQARGVPITGLGFQMHLRMDIPNETIAYCLQQAANTGLKIHLSELDLIFNRHDDTQGGGEQIYDTLTEEMKQAQAEKYRQVALMYRRIVPPEQRYGITFWDFTDRDTWIRDFFDLMDWPTLFDDSLRRKPAYEGFAQGLRESAG